MKVLRSATLWTMGSAFFVLTFVILSTGLFLLSRERVFTLARFLFSV